MLVRFGDEKLYCRLVMKTILSFVLDVSAVNGSHVYGKGIL